MKLYDRYRIYPPAGGTGRARTCKTLARAKYEAIFEFLSAREKTREGRLFYPIWRAASDVARENLLRVVFDRLYVLRNQLVAAAGNAHPRVPGGGVRRRRGRGRNAIGGASDH